MVRRLPTFPSAEPASKDDQAQEDSSIPNGIFNEDNTLWPSWIACIASPYTLRNETSLRIIHCNSARASIRRKLTYRSALDSYVSLSNGYRFRFVLPFGTDLLDGNPKNRY